MRRFERRYPEIKAINIDAPVFIVGLNRTGSTLLHRTMSLSKQCRGIKTYEMVTPYGSKGNFNPLNEESEVS